MSFKIRTKLIIAFFAVIVPFIVIGGILVLYSAHAIHKSVHKVQTISEERAEITNFILAMDKVIMQANDYIITGERKYVDNFYIASNEVEKRLQKANEVIHAEERKTISDAGIAWQNIKETALKIFAIPEPIGNKGAARLMEEMDYKWAYPAIERLKELRAMHIEEFKEAARVADRTWVHSWIVMIVGAFALTVIGIFFAFFYSSRFTRPIKAIHNGADAIAGGNFKTRLEIKTGDEIGQLSNAMNEMAAQLDSFYSNLQGMVDERTRELRESEEKYRLLVENIPDVVWITDESGRTSYISPNIEKVYGYTPDEIYADGEDIWFGRIHTADVGFVAEAFDQLFTENRVFDIEYRIKRKDGQWIWLHDRSIATEEKNGLKIAYGLFSDITERKKIEDALRKSEEKFRDLTESTSDWVWEVNEGGIYTYASPKVKDLLGYEPQEIIGKTPFDLMPNEEAKQVAEEFGAVANARRPFAGLENTNLNKDGRRVVLETSGMPIFDGEGKFRGYRGIDRDITERKKAEEALKESETRFRGIVETAKDAMICISEDGVIYQWNKSAEEMFGYSANEAISKDIHSLIIPERFCEKAYEGFKTFSQTGAGPVIGKTIEVVGLKKGGAEFPVELSVSAMNIKGRWHAVGIMRNITKRKETEYAIKRQLDELLRFQKATVDRELMMHKIKEESERLKKRIEELEKNRREGHNSNRQG